MKSNTCRSTESRSETTVTGPFEAAGVLAEGRTLLEVFDTTPDVLGNEGDYEAALPHFREALHQLPEDPQAMFGLAHALEKLDEITEADRIYRNLIDRFPASQVAEMAREARTGIAQQNLRSNVPGGFRPDVMMYIASALDTFDKLGPKKRQEIAVEIALLGQRGLEINDPAQKYALRTLPENIRGFTCSR